MGDYLTMNEKQKYEVIKRVVNQRITKQRASVQLGITVRQVNRLIIKYKEEGRKGFKHGNTSTAPANKLTKEVQQKIVQLYKETYYDFNFTHFHEKLIEDEGITISKTSVATILKRHNILSPKAHRVTKRNLKKQLEDKIDASKPLTPREKVLLDEVVQVDAHKAHPSRSRKKYAGELVQLDASQHQWFPTDPAYYHLHAGIDDCTGIVVGARFEEQELLDGYYEVAEQTFLNYGLPFGFLADKRSIFNENRGQKIDPPDDQRVLTQFGYACQTLGIELNTTSIPQAKGKIERLFNTFQDRLYSEMRLNNIQTIEQANLFLKSYLPKYNEQFALHIKDNMNVFEKLDDTIRLDHILARFAERKIQTGHAIQYEKQRYHLYDQYHKSVYLPKGTQILVIKTKNGELYASYKDQTYLLNPIPVHEEVSAEFDNEVKKEPRRQAIPPLTHPWKAQSYQQYLYKLKSKHKTR